MKRTIILSVALLAPTMADAQVAAAADQTATTTTVVAPVVAPPAPAMRQVVLPPNSEVVVTPNDTLTTKGKQLKEGYKFRISTVFDVMQDGIVMIPKGTPGEGTVTWMTNKGAFGKSGKMEVGFNWIELGGRRISLTGNHRQEGDGNTGATVGAAVAVGVFSAFVTGRSATIVNGQQLRARTVEPLTFEIPDNAQRVLTGSLVPTPAATPIATPVATPAAAPNSATN